MIRQEAAANEQAAAAAPKRAPPSRDAASRALLITGFIRPFTEKQAREKLSETGASFPQLCSNCSLALLHSGVQFDGVLMAALGVLQVRLLDSG